MGVLWTHGTRGFIDEVFRRLVGSMERFARRYRLIGSIAGLQKDIHKKGLDDEGLEVERAWWSLPRI